MDNKNTITFREFVEQELGITTWLELGREVFSVNGYSVPNSTLERWWYGNTKPPAVAWVALQWFLKARELQNKIERIVDMVEEGSGERDTNNDTTE